MEIQDFIEEYIEGEPLTKDTIAYAIKKFVYINYAPTKQEELQQYKELLWRIAINIKHNNPHKVDSLLKNITAWAEARANTHNLTGEKLTALKNETFYNLIKIQDYGTEQSAI